MARAKAEKKGKAGRPKQAQFAPLPAGMSDEDILKLLSTRPGIRRMIADLYRRFRKGGTALELEYMTRELRTLVYLERAIDHGEQEKVDRDLAENLAAVMRLMEGKRGSALRADMAQTPPPKRGKATLQ